MRTFDKYEPLRFEAQFTELSMESNPVALNFSLFIPPSLQPLGIYTDFMARVAEKYDCRVLVPHLPGFDGNHLGKNNIVYDGNIDQRAMYFADLIGLILRKKKRSLDTVICCGENALAGLTSCVLLQHLEITIKCIVLIDPTFRCLVRGSQRNMIGHAMCQLNWMEDFVHQRLFPLIIKDEGVLETLRDVPLSHAAMMFRYWLHGTTLDFEKYRIFCSRLLNENIATLLVVSNGDEYNETEVIDNIANILCCIESKDNKEALRSRLLRYDQTHRPRHQRSSHLLLDHSDSIIAEIERLHKFTELENDK
ncbi:hypothetical protein ACOME3_000386 [Neoechinorhynchus agilis]